MAINFPDAPYNGQTYTANGKTWIYNGSSWTGVFSNSGNAETLDNIDSTQFLRNDINNTATGVVTFANSSDYQIALNGNSSSWAGIQWTDVSSTDYIWFNGQYGTFSVGGSGANVSGKKLHVNGGLSVGSSASGAAVTTNGIYSQGGMDVGGNILPLTNNTQNLGSATLRWANIYTGDLNLSNQGSSNSVDGTWGDWTIQEGETDLFLINNRSGKRYQFLLREVSKE